MYKVHQRVAESKPIVDQARWAIASFYKYRVRIGDQMGIIEPLIEVL